MAQPSRQPEYDPRYLQGVEYFNACDFFEAHEVWESLWADDQSDSRRFYQGLIQAAVCLHHFGNGNARGARKLYYSSRNYLQPYAPWHMGIDVDKLLADLARCCEELIQSDAEWPDVPLDPERIPEIELRPFGTP